MLNLLMKILLISDKVTEQFYTPRVRERLAGVDFIISSGDLPFEYLEYLVTMTSLPLFYVVGNHGWEVRRDERGRLVYPGGCHNLDGKVVVHKGLILAGLEGSRRYNDRPRFQYTEGEMMHKLWKLAPVLLLNRIRYGRYLDILVTHAPPFGIHDGRDLCHTGFRAFLRAMEWFRPRYLIHGHQHIYRPDTPWRTRYRDTLVINAYGYRLLEVDGWPRPLSARCRGKASSGAYWTF